MKELSKTYNPKQEEQGIYQAWEESGFFNPDNLPLDKKAKAFSIALPPPNTTAELHMGHAVMLALQDIMVRYHRMKGDKTLWLPGTDHAAIATQNVVEKQLKAKGQTKEDLGRERFLELVDEYVVKSQGRIKEQIIKLGASLDWSRERFTLDDGLSKAVRTMFVQMHQDGLIYQGQRVVNWCPRCQSTLADDEVEYKKEEAPFYYFKYGPVIIGTARPETKFCDKIIIVHPEDKRYKNLVGKEFEVEWINGPIKARVIADESADPEMGTGAMTITPGHSMLDFELAKKHSLAIEKIINEQGRLTEAAGPFAGLPVKQAREKVVEILKDKGLLDRIDEDYVHNLSTCYRCGAPLEPLPSKQWFVSVDKPIKKLGDKSLKQRALEVIKKKEIAFLPNRFEKTYQHWMTNLHDWNISRQIWYGHQLPVWQKKTNPPVEITYFVHGTTLDNEKDIASGQSDVELSTLGKQQSLTLKKQLGNQKFDAVFTSNLKRAVESSMITFGGDYKIIQDARLRESDYGDLTQSPNAKLIKHEKDYVDKPFPGGESYRDVEKRLQYFLNELTEKYAGKRIAIVAHKAPQLALEVLLNKKSWTQAMDQDWRKVKKWQPGWSYILPSNKTWDLKLYGQDTLKNIKSGLTKFETRAGKPSGASKDWRQFKIGDYINFTLVDSKSEKPAKENAIKKRVAAIYHFPTVEKMFSRLPIEKVAPGSTLEKYNKRAAGYPDYPERLAKYGVWAFELTDEQADIGETYVGLQSPEGPGWKQVTDTLDTWFSSGLWTFSTLGWPDKTEDLKTFHPTSVMETGYDILFFWVARMILMSTYALCEIPFKTVYLHGLVRDSQGRKMSKSLGNGIDPLAMTDKYGADATRLSLVISTAPGNDMRLSEQKIAGYRNFVNKLWNISRFSLLQGADRVMPSDQTKTLADQWILSRLNRLISQTTKDLNEFKFSPAAEAVYNFAWHEFADWYLEIAKAEKNIALVRYILENILKLLHPYLPFFTERIWRELYPSGPLLLITRWPEADKKKISAKSEADFVKLQKTVQALRAFKLHSKLTNSETAALDGKTIFSQELLTLLSGIKITVQPAKDHKTIVLGSARFSLPASRVKSFTMWTEQEKTRLDKLISAKEQALKNSQLPDNIRSQFEEQLKALQEQSKNL
ncbi:MAG: class I tRNA ligase family protein [bacterium]